MTLKQALNRIDDWRNKDAATLLVELTAVNYEKKPVAERIWSIAGVAKFFGVQIAETIYAALLAAGSPGIAARFAATGLDATDPQWLTTSDALIAGPLASVPAETQQALKYIGHNRVVLWEEPVTEQQVSDAKQELINDQRLVNATALFSERMTIGGDPAAVWSQAWTDAIT